MIQSASQKFAQAAGLSALVLLALSACAGNGGAASTGPQVSTFKPAGVKATMAVDNFSTPQGGIVTVPARRYTFNDGVQNPIAMGISADTPAGQALKEVKDAKYVATDFCAGFSAEKIGSCDYIAVMLYRSQSGKNETRSFLFKPNAQGEYDALCNRDIAYTNSEEAFKALKAECDPDQQIPAATPASTPAPTPTATP